MTDAQMNTCKTCRHWKNPAENEDYHATMMTSPLDQDTYRPMVMPFEVRLCEHPAQTRFERPVTRDGFGVCDGSGYLALLATAEAFGCVLHQP